jgi:hypothetical protein
MLETSFVGVLAIDSKFVTEAGAEIACSHYGIRIHGHLLDLPDGLLEGNGQDVWRVQCDHGAELALLHESDGCRSKPQRNQPVVRRWCAPALEVTEHQ